MAMLRSARAMVRLARVAVHLLHGLGWVLLAFGWLGAPARQRRIQWWSAKTLRLLGIPLEVRGSFRSGAALLVANHVSWLDIPALHAVCPRARFVSKADVARWPLLGHLVASAGTLYLERERKRDALRVVHDIADALRGGDLVAVFPEGTTGDGRQLLPFHANLLQAAIATATPVQPVALSYVDAAGPRSQAVTWLGDVTLVQSLWRVACAQSLRIRIDIMSPESSRHADRRALASTLRQRLDAQLALAAAEYAHASAATTP